MPVLRALGSQKSFIAVYGQRIVNKNILPLPLLLALLPLRAVSQTITPTPDGTGTIINYNGNTYTITGGTQTGANLFHSFQELGLSPNQIANFLSTPNIQNILGRITGGNPSIIQGLITVTGGNSNLFLMNPAGFIFGQNASINVPGDFTVTTADAIGFEGGFFSATGDNDYSTLVGAPNHFAFASANPGSIVNAANLTVGEGQNLTLVGGSILNTGTLNAGGNITLTAVPGGKTVRINQEGMVLGLEVTPQSITNGISAVDLPRLLTNPNLRDATGVEVDNNGTIRLTGSTVTLNPDSNVTIAGNVRGESVNLAAANRVVPIGDPLTLIRTGHGTYSAPTVTLFPKTGSEPNAYIFLDATVPDYSQFLYGGKPGTTTVVVTPVENGIEKITATLATEGINPVDELHILSEGDAGEFWLGNAFVSSDNVGQYETQMQSWANNLAPGADILIYACFTALGESGSALLNSIADVTGTDVAGSTTLTGSATQGGDWVLERATGIIEASNPFTQEVLETFAGTLQVFTATDAASLITAITTANGNAQVDTINLAGDITLTAIDNMTNGANGLPSILADGGNSLTINGMGNTLARDAAAPDFRLLHVSLGAELEVNETTLSGGIANAGGAGDDGGAIHNRGTLTINNSTITGNSAADDGGGISSFGNTATVATVNIIDSTISGNTGGGNGGGLSNTSFTGAGANSVMMNITNSTISGNNANVGGGIASLGQNANNSAVINVTNSTISGNTVVFGGGGIYNRGQTAVLGSTINITNSTITQNAVTNPGSSAGGILNLHVGGGANTALVNVSNSIIAQNTATVHPDVRRISATISPVVDQGNNLIGADSQALFTTSTLVGSVATPLDPQLLPLGDYGGATQTHAFFLGSPVIDAGSNALATAATLTTDQRGANRFNGTVDIGAFELQGFSLTPVTGTTPQSTNVDTAFGTDLAVQLTENFANSAIPLAGLDVTFAAPTSGASGTFGNGTTLTTDANGMVTNLFTANGIGGTYQVTATATNITGANFDLTNVAPSVAPPVAPPVTPPVTPTTPTVTPTVTSPVTPPTTPTATPTVTPTPTQPAPTLTEPPESNTIPQPQSLPQNIPEIAFACISPNDPVLYSLDRALPQIAQLLERGGGSLSINVRNLLQNCGESLSGLPGNQRLIRGYLLREVEERLGADVLSLVSVDFVPTLEGITAIINVSP